MDDLNRVKVVSFLINNYRSYEWNYEETNEYKKFSTVIKGREYALIKEIFDGKYNIYISVNFDDENLIINASSDIHIYKLWVCLWDDSSETRLDKKWGVILSELID